MLDLPAEQAALVLREVPRLCRAVAAATDCDGINVWQNSGPASNQVVFHLHIHIIPRFHGDDVPAQIAARKQLSAEESEALVAKIKAALARDIEPASATAVVAPRPWMVTKL